MAVTNIHQFQAGIRRHVLRVHDRRREIVKVVGLRALRELVLNTRVDTGRARGNYQVAEGSPPTGEIDRFDQTGSEGSADTISIGSAEILAASGDTIIWIHNGVPYIGVLEDKDKMLVGTVEALKTWLRSFA